MTIPILHADPGPLNLAGKRVCLVGNSPTITSLDLGQAIDEHDTIIRCNRHAIGGEHAAAVGSRPADLVACNEWMAQELVHDRLPLLVYEPTEPVPRGGIRRVAEIDLADPPPVWLIPPPHVREIHDALNRVGIAGRPLKPTLGLIVATWLAAVCDVPPFVCGFSFQRTAQSRYHAAPSTHAAAGQNYIVHHPLSEAVVMLAPFRAGRLRVDQHMAARLEEIAA